MYWRPGCPFCQKLRLGLFCAGLKGEWINIWDDAGAAAHVRSITGGNETVPTVIVGGKAMVNPSARQVVAAARAGRPPAVRDDSAATGRFGRMLAALREGETIRVRVRAEASEVIRAGLIGALRHAGGTGQFGPA